MALPLGAVQVAVVGFISFTLAIIAICLRFWSKSIMKLPLLFHDYMAIVAMVLTAGTVSVFLAAAFAAGLGLHLQDIMTTDPQMFALHLRLFVPAQLLWAAANTSVKLSILSLYTTIFRARKIFSYICYGTMLISVAYFTSVFLETFLLCKPVQYSWDKTIPGGTCTGENLAYLIAGITNLVIDAFIVALPMPMLFGLQMTLSKKLGIAAMFSLGAVICVMSLMRVIWLHTWDLTDMTYTVTPGAIYSILEPTLGVVNACLPTIRPALQRIFKTKALHWSKAYPSGTENSGMDSHNHKKRLGTRDKYQRSFDRLDDDVPLTTIQAGSHLQDTLQQPDGIQITTQWEVESSLSDPRRTVLVANREAP